MSPGAQNNRNIKKCRARFDPNINDWIVNKPVEGPFSYDALKFDETKWNKTKFTVFAITKAITVCLMKQMEQKINQWSWN